MADKRKSAFLLPALVLIPAAWAAAGDYGTVDAVAGDTVAVLTPVPHPEVTWVPEDYITEIGSFKRGDGAPVDTLDIGDGYLQLVLFDDYSWRYIKNMKKVLPYL